MTESSKPHIHYSSPATIFTLKHTWKNISGVSVVIVLVLVIVIVPYVEDIEH